MRSILTKDLHQPLNQPLRLVLPMYSKIYSVSWFCKNLLFSVSCQLLTKICTDIICNLPKEWPINFYNFHCFVWKSFSFLYSKSELSRLWAVCDETTAYEPPFNNHGKLLSTTCIFLSLTTSMFAIVWVHSAIKYDIPLCITLKVKGYPYATHFIKL